MENKKELERATYQVTKVLEEYVVQGRITYDDNNELVEVQNGRISRNGEFLASFNHLNGTLIVRYNDSVLVAEQIKIIELISDFKK